MIVPDHLSDEVVSLLSSICFGSEKFSELERAEAVLIFGTSNPYSQLGCALNFPDVIKKTKAKKVFITGGRLCDDIPESEVILNMIHQKWYQIEPFSDRISFMLDKKSMNTKENVEEAIDLGLSKYRCIVIIAKSNHCGRCLLTLRKYMPEADLQWRGYPYTIDGLSGTMSLDFWPKDPKLSRVVWGEFLKIEEYGKKGDIAYPEEVRQKVERIHQLTGTIKN